MKGDILPTMWNGPNEPPSADNSSALRKPGLTVPMKYDEVAFQSQTTGFFFPPQRIFFFRGDS